MTLFKDSYGQTSPDLQSFAQQRVTQQAPLLGGIQCHAAEYTFAVSEDGGRTWHNPSTETRQALTEAITATGLCCQQLGQECPLRFDIQ